MQLETERLIIRPWTMEDVEEIYELAKDEHVGPPCGWTPHKSSEESAFVLKNILINDYTFALVLKDNNKIIGDIGIMPNTESKFCENEKQAEIGFWLGFQYWGKGYMPEACKRMIQYGFNELGLEKIWCSHNTDNHNSKRVQEKSGFEFVRMDEFYSRAKECNVEVCLNCIEADKWILEND